jgi:hypothetical protein
MRYAIRHWPGLVAFLDDGRIEMDSNTVERIIRLHTLTRKNSLFEGSDGGARHWSIAMTLIQTAKLNEIDPMAWLTDVLERVVSGRTKANELHALLPRSWAASRQSEIPSLAAMKIAASTPRRLPQSSRMHTQGFSNSFVRKSQVSKLHPHPWDSSQPSWRARSLSGPIQERTGPDRAGALGRWMN